MGHETDGPHRASTSTGASGTSTATSSVASWSTWVAASTAASTSQVRRARGRTGCVPMSSTRRDGCATQHPLPGRQLRVRLSLARRRRPGRGAARTPTRPGTPSNPTTSAPTSSSASAASSRRSRTWSSTAATATCARRATGSSTATARRYRAGQAAPAHGFAAPHRVSYWGIGNEVDGHWQIGMKTPEEYARAYTEYAKVMRWVDPEHQADRLGRVGLGGRDRSSARSCCSSRQPSTSTTSHPLVRGRSGRGRAGLPGHLGAHRGAAAHRRGALPG